MTVKLISYSFPSSETYEKGIDDVQDLVSYCAKVSNPANQASMETSERLISYLIKHKHWSPFEMASACLEIETTRDIARQILRHRSFSFQEFSQRYADINSLGDNFITREARLQDTKNRQNSVYTDNVLLKKEWYNKQMALIDLAKETYNWAIENGIAKEQARCVLPEGNTKSKLYMNGSIRSWIHYIDLRAGNGTQLEHRQIALECATELAKIFPLIKKLTLESTSGDSE